MMLIFCSGIFPHVVSSMLPPMKTQFAPLPEGLVASIYSAYEGFFISMGILVLFAVLKQGKGFWAVATDIRLQLCMDQLMASEGEAGDKILATSRCGTGEVGR
jgi:hypothetical protein